MAAMSRFYQLDSPGVSHPFFSSSRPLVFAHRGAGALAPENTIAAFDNGLALGADGLELDVRLSRDGVVVVHHDATLERTSDGRGAVSDLSFEQLARLDAGYHFRRRDGLDDPGGSCRGQGISIPSLEAVLRRYPGALFIIELKVPSAELVRRTVDLLKHAGALPRAAVGSFSRRALQATRALE